MRLLQKTNRIYLLFSGGLLLLAGCLLYFMMTDIIGGENDEKLLVNKLRITQQIEKGEEVKSIPPIIEVIPLKIKTSPSLTIRDTNLTDLVEGDVEPFREITAVEEINDTFYKITVRQVALEPHDYLNSIGGSLGIILVLLLIGLLLINRFIAKKLWTPFYQNLEILKQFSLQDNQPILLKDSSISEFKELNESLTKLTHKVSSDYHSLKEFTENASHEIQTPLAIIQTKLEEALQSQNITEEQIKLIAQASSSAQRLSKLNQSLLLLTKIENQQFNEQESISLKTAIATQLQLLEDFILTKELKVEMEIEEDIFVNGNAILIDTLMSNLIGNAIKHNIKNGALSIELSAKKLIIKNTGEQLEVNPNSLFERFSKNNPSSTSLGLGLAIVKKIIELNHWQINYSYQNDWHEMTINF